jgi:hypothetical protein
MQSVVYGFYAWNTYGILMGSIVNYTGYDVLDQEPSIEKFCIELRGRCILTISFRMPMHFSDLSVFVMSLLCLVLWN